MLHFKRILRWGLVGIGGLGLLAGIGLAVTARTVKRPANLGVVAGRLAVCPPDPNCVSSQADDALHQIAPLAYTGTTAAAMQHLVTIVQAQPRTTILQATPTYLAVVFRSATFQFPDDGEFVVDEANKLIHFRSASRIGKGDMGVNRARMTTISRLFTAQAGASN